MSREVICGFESGYADWFFMNQADVVTGVYHKDDFSTLLNGSDLQQPVAGNYSLVLENNGFAMLDISRFLGETDNLYLKFLLQVPSTYLSGTILTVRTGGLSGTLMTIINDAGKLRLYNGYMEEARSWTAISANRWYLIEFYMKVSSTRTIADGAYELRIDGRRECYSNAAKTNVLTTAQTIKHIVLTGATSYHLFDDFALDSTASFDIGSDSHVLRFKPSSNGTTNQWTAYPSGSNYEVVDDSGPEDIIDTDYIKTNQVNQKDSYPVVLDGTATLGTIYNVQINHRTERLGRSTPTAVKPYLRINASEYDNGSETEVGYGRPNPITRIWDQNPDTLTDWIESDITSLELGIKSE